MLVEDTFCNPDSFLTQRIRREKTNLPVLFMSKPKTTWSSLCLIVEKHRTLEFLNKTNGKKANIKSEIATKVNMKNIIEYS